MAMSAERESDATDDPQVAPEKEPEPVRAVEAAEEAPIVDPLAGGTRSDEVRRIALETLAERARWLSTGCFVAGAAGAAVAGLGLAGRLDLGALLYLVPMAVVNVVIGVLLRRAGVSLSALSKSRTGAGEALTTASVDLSKVFTLQLVATTFFVLLVVVSLVSALLVKHVTEL